MFPAISKSEFLLPIWLQLEFVVCFVCQFYFTFPGYHVRYTHPCKREMYGTFSLLLRPTGLRFFSSCLASKAYNRYYSKILIWDACHLSLHGHEEQHFIHESFLLQHLLYLQNLYALRKAMLLLRENMFLRN